MLPRILVIETKLGDAALALYKTLKTINANIYLATMLNEKDVQKKSIAFCKGNHYVYVENAYIKPIDDKLTVPRLGIYTNFLEQENTYLAYYQNEMIKVKKSVDYLLKKVNPTHVIVNAGCISMYNVFVRYCVNKMFDNVLYYAEKPQTTKSDYIAVNELMLRPRVTKVSLTPKDISEKIKEYKKYYGDEIIKLYPNIFTYPEEMFKL